ncbi:hypothetical protein P9Z59_13655 [Bacillus thuringiensis]|uniref:Uncharacterized protein n=1 Tax=Bacillus thuringiensis subsp. tolworthi TaxID=1442 RepID=A0A9W4A5N5_BACTO|nr:MULTISPECIES: hypothetical protein [Bacillus cereus group]MDA2526209.1 hypothetical protein [Bacillus cereus]MDA2561883.1 hypothetical protein [Bacillus cereus]MDY7963827.1 hypothetical protein [Bacillus thuringiensis]MEB8855527.1 hypothetical protein [Bacillus cereus]MEB9421313.1 hypothetical protein [Bacillus cereus]
MTNQLTEQLIKMDGPSPEALKLLKAFLMRTSVPRIAAQRIKDKSEVKS